MSPRDLIHAVCKQGAAGAAGCYDANLQARDQHDGESRQEPVQVIVTAVEFHKLYPVYRACILTESVNEQLCESVGHSALFEEKGFIVFLRPVTNWLDNVCVQIFVVANQAPKVLANNL